MALTYATSIQPSNDTWPLIASKHVKGGVHYCVDNTDLETLATYTKMLEPGMFAYVESDDKYYRWHNSQWVEVKFGGGGEEQTFPYNAVYFVSSNSNLTTIPIEEGETVKGLTSTKDMSHRYDCSVFNAPCYVYFAIPIVVGKEFEYLVNGMLSTAYEKQNESPLVGSDTSRNLYRLSNALGGSKITLLTKEY